MADKYEESWQRHNLLKTAWPIFIIATLALDGYLIASNIRSLSPERLLQLCFFLGWIVTGITIYFFAVNIRCPRCKEYFFRKYKGNLGAKEKGEMLYVGMIGQYTKDRCVHCGLPKYATEAEAASIPWEGNDNRMIR